MQNVALRDSLRAESARICVLGDFKHASADVLSVLTQEPFDVVAIDRRASVEPEDATDRPRAAQAAPAYLRRRSQPPQKRAIEDLRNKALREALQSDCAGAAEH